MSEHQEDHDGLSCPKASKLRDSWRKTFRVVCMCFRDILAWDFALQMHLFRYTGQWQWAMHLWEREGSPMECLGSMVILLVACGQWRVAFFLLCLLLRRMFRDAAHREYCGFLWCCDMAAAWV